MIKVEWGTPAQHYILHDYPNGVAEIPEEQGGEHKFAFGMERAQVWQKQATILKALLEEAKGC